MPAYRRKNPGYAPLSVSGVFFTNCEVFGKEMKQFQDRVLEVSSQSQLQQT